jgi:mannose-6-phosphate isomerase-like protein (cupin superfamily)
VRIRDPEDALTEKVNLAEALSRFDDRLAPRIVGYLNKYKLQVVKVEGEFVWHSHPETDDFFLVLDGRLKIQLRDRDVELCPGELFVVPRGVEHCPRADEETHVLLIEPRDTLNTGDAGGPLTTRGEPLPEGAG